MTKMEMTKKRRELTLLAILLTVFAISIPAADLTTNTAGTTAVPAEGRTNGMTTVTAICGTNGTVATAAKAGTNGTVIVTVTVRMPGTTNVIVTTVTATNPVAKPKPIWVSSAALGLTLTRGNSDTILFSGSFQAERKRDIYELSLGLDATYGEDRGVRNNESARGFAQYNQLLTRKFFVYARVNGLHDGIADIDYRLSFSPGVGYYLLKYTNTTLSVEAGPAVTWERTGNDTETYANLRVAEKFQHRVNSHVRLWQGVEVLPELTRGRNFVVNSELGIESGLTRRASLRVVLQDTYENEPAPDRKANDLKLITSLVYKF